VVVVAPQKPPIGRTLARDIALYSVARLALVTVAALVLFLVGVPLLVSALLAMVLALPLSMVLLGGLRGRVNTGLAVVAVLAYRAFSFWLPTIPGTIAYLQLRKTVKVWSTEEHDQAPARA